VATGSRIFTSTAQSPYQIALHNEAKAAGISLADLRELLCVINADPDLIAFPTACKTILWIFHLIKKIWRVEPKDWGLDRWAAVACWVVVSRKKLATAIGGDFDPQGITRNAMIGNGVDRHPLYAMLLSTHKGDSAEKRRYRLLQAHLLTAVIRSLRRKYPFSQDWSQMIADYEAHTGNAEWKPLENSIRDVCVTVRRLAEGSHVYEPYFKELKVELPPLKFAEKFLTDAKLSSIAVSDHWRNKRHTPFRIFLRKVFKDREFKGHKKTTTSDRKTGPIRREMQEIGKGLVHRQRPTGDPDDKYSDKSTVTQSVRCKKKTQEEINAALDADDDPFVEEGDEDIYQKVAEDAGRRTPSVCSWHQLLPITMQNQLLPLSYGNLARTEAKQVVRESEIWLVQTESGLAEHPGKVLNPRQLLELRLWIMLLTMLATGGSQERAQSLFIFPPGTPDKPTDLALFLPTDPKKCASWRLAVINLPYKHHPESEASTRRMHSEYIRIPDLLGVGRFIELLPRRMEEELTGSDSSPVAFQPLRGRATKVLCRLKEHLAKLDPEGRLTVAKVAGFLFSQMMVKTNGDVTAAAIVAGQNLPIARTRLFYACVRLRRIQDAYAEVFRELNTHGFASSLTFAFADKDLWIVTRPCPTRSAVQNLLVRLRNTMNRVKPYRGNEQFAKYHNAFVLYTFLFQAYSIGTRAVNSPILDPSRIAEDGFVWVDDKDTGAHYNAHLALCPEPFLEHLEFFNQHLGEVRRELSWKITKACDRERLAQTCFFLRNTEGGLRVEEATRGAIESMFKEFNFGFPVNVHRRFVSGELLDGLVEIKTKDNRLGSLKWNGVAPELVDWWMSHWSVGEEPWNKSSSLSPETYRAGLKKPLRALLKSLGFKPKPTALFTGGSEKR
jgi:hypothetical protein